MARGQDRVVRVKNGFLMFFFANFSPLKYHSGVWGWLSGCRGCPRRVQRGERLLQPGGVRRAHRHPKSHLRGTHQLQGHGHRQVSDTVGGTAGKTQRDPPAAPHHSSLGIFWWGGRCLHVFWGGDLRGNLLWLCIYWCMRVFLQL